MFRSLRQLLTTNRTSLCFLSFLPRTNYDNPNPYADDPKEGFERVKFLFQFDKYGEPRKEMILYARTCFGNGVLLGCYGAFRGAKIAYEEFIEIHRVSSYVSPFVARRKLQDHTAKAFLKNFLIWGTKGVLVSACFMGIILLVSAYRGKDGFIEFIPAGFITGLLFKALTGLQGMITGAVIGTMTGVVFGGTLHFASWFEKLTVSDVEEWQYQRVLKREASLEESREKSALLIDAHNSHTQNVGLTTPEKKPKTPSESASSTTNSTQTTLAQAK